MDWSQTLHHWQIRLKINVCACGQIALYSMAIEKYLCTAGQKYTNFVKGSIAGYLIRQFPLAFHLSIIK